MSFCTFSKSYKIENNDSKKFLIVGLGNIGSEYKGTRHNVGFLVLDQIAANFETSFDIKKLGAIAEFQSKGKKIILLKPSTFMNRSGKAVRYWMLKERIPIQNLLVVTDDLHLNFGMLRMRKKGSDGGHNGLKDIQAQLNTTNYPRLRFGIGNHFGKGNQIHFVLDTWSKEELTYLEHHIKRACEATLSFATQGISNAMNAYNGSA